jgi:hypothetical protein|tara:strand:+ start:1047 stop:2150 length:1104 start_codon:yes stop_codon:yes gene_type:complete
MIDPNEKIALDDIMFDDILDGGVATEPVDAGLEIADDLVEEPEVEEEVIDDLSDDLGDDQGDEDSDDEVEDKPLKEKTVEDSDGESNTVVGDILEKLGYDTENEYDDTTEGLLQLTQDVGSQMAEDQLDQLFEKFPLVKNHLQYVLSGGDSQQFMKAYDPNNDYSKMDVSEGDIGSQRAVLSDYFKAKGHDSEFIEEILEDYQDSGKLFTKATRAKDALAQSQAKEREQLLEGQKSQQAETSKKQKEFWNGVYDTIENSNEFAGLTVPKREKSKFFGYISNPVNSNGQTQRDIDHGSAEMEVKLAIDYLMFKGFKLDDIIKTKAKTSNAKSLRDKISKNEEKIRSAKKTTRRSRGGSVDLDNLDLNF